MKLTNLEDLYLDQLKDLFSAEKQLLKALPRMAKAASSPELRTAFESHRNQTEQHVERLKQVFDRLGARPGGKECKAMEGLIEEGEEYVKEKNADPEVIDAALIAAAQKIEHYEIGSYGTVRTFAQVLGDADAAELLQETLDEEGDADKKLTAIAETINPEAAEEGSEEEEEIEEADEAQDEEAKPSHDAMRRKG